MLGITRRAAVLSSAADGHPARLFKGGEPGFCLPSVAEALRFGALRRNFSGDVASAGDTIFTVYDQTDELEVAPTSVSFAGESSQVSPGVYRILSTAGAFSATYFALPAGTYRMTFDVVSWTSGAPVVTTTIVDVGTIPAGVGSFRGIAGGVSTAIGIKRASGVTDFTIANVRFFRQKNATGAQQVTTTKRPLLTVDSKNIPLLRFDGIDDCLSTSAIDFSTCDAVTVIAGLRKNAGTSSAMLVHQGVTSASGYIGVYCPVGSANSGNHLYAETRTTVSGGWYYMTTDAPQVFGQVFVVGATSRTEKLPSFIVTGNTMYPRSAGGSDPAGAASFQNSAIHVGQGNATVSPFSGDLYSLTVIGRRLSNSELLNTSRWINQQMGGAY